MDRTVLLIEDSPGHGEDIVHALAGARCHIERVMAGPRAISRASESKPDLLLADVSLSNGAALKNAETLGWVDGIPCVMVVGLPFLATEHSMGSMTFLKCVFWRPYSAEALRERVEKLLDLQVREAALQIPGGP